jgi:hypothetical protein
MVTDRVDRLMSVPSWTEPKRAVQEVGLKDRLEYQHGRRLNDPVLDRGDAHSALPLHPDPFPDLLRSPIRIIRSGASVSKSSEFAEGTILTSLS